MTEEDRTRALLDALGLEQTPKRMGLVGTALATERDLQREADAALCRIVAADARGAAGEKGSDVEEMALQCALSIERRDPGACDEAAAEPRLVNHRLLTF